MGPQDADESPPLSPMQRRGVIEVDTFCTGCHYNLHGQAVTVDDRLGIPVCRCPECGRFHPAGVGVTASGVWVRRLATVLLFNWVGIVLVGTLTLCFFLGLLSAGSVGIYQYGAQVTPDGRPVEYRPMTAKGGLSGYQYVIAGTDTPVPRVVFAERLHPIFPPAAAGDDRGVNVAPNPYTESQRASPGPVPWYWLSGGSLALGALAGALCVSLLWHWPRRRYLWCLLLPAAAAGVLMALYATADEFFLIRGEAIGRAAVQLAIQCVGVGVGIGVGRPIARAVVRTVVPPKPRQALAFLWQVDGKALPV